MTTTTKVRIPQVVALTTEVDRDNPAYLYVNGLKSKAGRETQKSALAGALAIWSGKDRLAKLTAQERSDLRSAIYAFKWNGLTRNDLMHLVSEMQNLGYAGQTQQRVLSAVRRVLELCSEASKLSDWHMEEADYRKAIKPDKSMQIKRTKGRKVGRKLSATELRKLFQACEVREQEWTRERTKEHPTTAARDRAILALLFLRGMRVAEVCALNANALNRSTWMLTISDSKTDSGIRKIPIGGPTKRFLSEWLDLREGPKDGPLFLRISKVGTVLQTTKVYAPACAECALDFQALAQKVYANTGRSAPIVKCPNCGTDRPYSGQRTSLNTATARKMLIKRAELAGIDRPTTHDGRRTVATQMLEKGRLEEARELLGHSDAATTLSYGRYSDAKRKASIRALDVEQDQILDGQFDESEDE